MKTFLIDLENKKGELARVGETLGAKGINITGATGVTCGTSGRIALMTSDDAATATTLRDGGFKFTETESVEANISNQPGGLGKAARRLADAGINIEAVMATGMVGDQVTIAWVTDNPAKAKEALATTASAR